MGTGMKTRTNTAGTVGDGDSCNTHRPAAGVDDISALFVALRALRSTVDREESTRLATRADAQLTVAMVATRHALMVFATPAAVRRALG